MNPPNRTIPPSMSDLLLQLEDYSPTIPDAVTAYYLNSAGFEAKDKRLVRLVSLASQKFISDIANDAMHHCRTRGAAAGGAGKGAPPLPPSKAAKDKRHTMTMDDLAPVLAEYGITVKKPQYYT